jgi:hypothetical protein
VRGFLGESIPQKRWEKPSLRCIVDVPNLPNPPGARHRWGRTRLPSNVSQVLDPFKRSFPCAQAQHVLGCCWLVVAWLRAPGQGTLKGLGPYLPPTLRYWTTLRMVRSGHWDAPALVSARAAATLRALPPPADGILSLMGESTLQEKRGRKPPLGPTTRQSEHDPYTFGFEMVWLMASWGACRVPIALAPIDPQYRGPQNILCRQMLKDFVPPAWVRQIIVVADAGFAANAPRRLIHEKKYA